MIKLWYKFVIFTSNDYLREYIKRTTKYIMSKIKKEQIALLPEESERLDREAKKQSRTKSNLGRLYILAGLKKDEGK